MSKQFKDLKYFKGWTLENFPFIEDDFDAITTYQFMCKIVEYLNEVIYNEKILEENNEVIKTLVEELKAYVDEYLEDLTGIKEEIERIETDLTSLTSQVNENTQAIDDLDSKIDLSIDNLKIYTDNLVQDNFVTLKNYVDYNDSVLNEKIDNIQIGAISVYNPTTGTLDPLQIVINDLYELTNRDGLTATEFDALDLTATEFDAYQITAREFDSEGKIILV